MSLTALRHGWLNEVHIKSSDLFAGSGGPGGPYGITYPNYHPGGPLYPSLAGGNYLSMAPAQLTTPRHLLLQHGSLPRGKVGWGGGGGWY